MRIVHEEAATTTSQRRMSMPAEVELTSFPARRCGDLSQLQVLTDCLRKGLSR
jgi:hypothetical protein